MRVNMICVTTALAALTLAAAAQQAPTGLQMVQAQLGTAVENRQLTGAATTFPMNSQVYVWMEITGGPSDPITVTWKHGDVSHSTQLAVGSSHWRTWAVKTVGAAGAWTVTIAGPAGKELKSLSFTVQ